MFSKLKQFKDLRKQAKVMQNALAEETVRVEKNGIVVAMNGNLRVTNILINDNLAKDKLENSLAECVNEAMEKTKKKMAQKMQEMGGLSGVGL